MNILSAVLRVGRNHFSPDVTLDDDLKEVWGMDSLDAIEIIMEVEAELDISLDEEKVGEYTTLRELAERVPAERLDPSLAEDF